jgi:hypothetical protein
MFAVTELFATAVFAVGRVVAVAISALGTRANSDAKTTVRTGDTRIFTFAPNVWVNG